MTTAALIVGIDGYAERPLTSSINDAKAFRKALIDLNLVAAKDIKILTTPVGDSDGPATRDSILDTLYDYYAKGDSIDRFYFYYAGHGLLAYTDESRARTCTALVPSDVTDLDKHAAKLISINEVREYLELVGPQEQFYIIDACRDIPYESLPSVGKFLWKARQLDLPRAQATLYAVSPQGTARASVGGMGVMTSHLLEALEGKGVALEYDDENDKYAVTIRSVSDYVKDAIGQIIKDEPLWKRKISLPALDDPDPKTGIIVEVSGVTPRPLTIHIVPDEAADYSEVTISKGRDLLEHSWPPNHVPVDLEPQRYIVRASSSPPAGQPDPSHRPVDLRKENEVTIRVPLGPEMNMGPPPSLPPVAPDSGPTAPRVEITGAPSFGLEEVRSLNPTGRVKASALESAVTIELRALKPPYKSWTAKGTLHEAVPIGPYRLAFRLGTDTFNETEIFISEGEIVEVSPTVAAPPLVREALAMTEAPDATQISESIGDIQAGVLQTMLPIIGVKPFDRTNTLFNRFTGLIEQRDPMDFGMRPVSLVIAVDGNEWGGPPSEVLKALRCHVVENDRIDSEEWLSTPDVVPLQRTNLEESNLPAGQGRGFDRIGVGMFRAPSNSFTVVIDSPHFGKFRLAVASLHNRVTVASFILRPDGSLDISQNLLPIPGDDLPIEMWPTVTQGGAVNRYGAGPLITYGGVVRELQIGQMLYQSGELFALEEGRLRLVDDLMKAKWTDPILSSMSYYEQKRAMERATPAERSVIDYHLSDTAANLRQYYPEFPDSRVIYGLTYPEKRDEMFSSLIDKEEIPVLAESAMLLLGQAREWGIESRELEWMTRRIAADQKWTLAFD